MTTLALLTADDLAPLQTKLDTLLALLNAAAQPADDYLSLDQVAALTHTSRKTVLKWVEEGKRDAKGKLIKLFTLEFSPGFRRVPRSALLAFGQAQGFDGAQLALPPAGARPVAAPKPARPARVPEGAAVMRRAS